MWTNGLISWSDSGEDNQCRKCIDSRHARARIIRTACAASADIIASGARIPRIRPRKRLSGPDLDRMLNPRPSAKAVFQPSTLENREINKNTAFNELLVQLPCRMWAKFSIREGSCEFLILD